MDKFFKDYFYDTILKQYTKEMTEIEVNQASSRDFWTPIEGAMYLLNITIPNASEVCALIINSKIKVLMAIGSNVVSNKQDYLQSLKKFLGKPPKETNPYLMDSHRKELIKILVDDFPDKTKNAQCVFFLVNRFLEKNYHEDYKSLTNHKLIEKVKEKFRRYYDIKKEGYKTYQQDYPFLYHYTFGLKNKIHENSIDGVKFSEFPKKLQCAIQIYIQCWHNLPARMAYPKKDAHIIPLIQKYFPNLTSSECDQIYKLSKQLKEGDTEKSRSSKEYSTFLPLSERK